MHSKCSLVVTSIGDGVFLKNYADQIVKEDFVNRCDIIVIPDRKTTPQLFEEYRKIKKQGIQIECPTIEEQDTYLKKLGDIHKIIPYDAWNRRNIGFLMALEKGSDFLISVDDDNYCQEKKPFFKEHACVCQKEIECEAVSSSNGWFNVCDLMVVEPANVYPRGFPYHPRLKSPKIDFVLEKGKVHINAGLWLQEPDLDAITWLATPAKALSFKGKSVFLGNNTWSPINTQNTALNRDAVTAYYFIGMGYPIDGIAVDRYGDIFSGYFTQKCAQHLGYRVRIGTPVANHIRNTHNCMKDATLELAAICIIEELSEWLRELKISGNTYEEAYLSLASQLEDAIEKFSGFIWNGPSRKYFHEVTKCMRIWIKTVKNIKT